MSDVSQAFAPVRAILHTAPLGTDVSTVTGTGALPAEFTNNGAIDLATGYSFTPAGTPTRTVTREYYDDQIFHSTETPSDDLPTWDITFLESNLTVVQNAFGAEVEEDGSLVYVGGIPEHKVMVLDLADGAASPKTRRFLVPDTSIALNGSVNPSGSSKLEKYPIRFSGNPTTGELGVGVTGLFRMWSSWLVDAS